MLMKQNFDLIWSKLSKAITSRIKRLPGLDILSGHLREVRLYIFFSDLLLQSWTAH